MKCFGLFSLLFILCSCGQSTQIHEDIVDINNTVVSLEKQLPAECKTPEINAKMEKIKAKTQQVEVVCNAQLEVANNEKVRWKTMFYALAIVMLVYFARRLVK